MKKLKVLLIEDDKVDQMAFQRVFKENKLLYEYTIASSVAEAKNILASNNNNFDLIISDYLLGDGTAFDIFDLKVDVPIIVTTGSGDEAVAAKAMKAGAYDYLIKDPASNHLKVLPATIENVMARKKAEEELRKSEERYRLLVEMMGEGMGIFDSDGKVTYVNPSLCEMLDYASDEMIGRHGREFIDDANQAILDELLSLGQEELGKVYEIEWTKKDGSKVATIMSPRPLYGADNKFIGCCVVVTDITKRKHAEEQIKVALRDKELLLRETHHRVKNNLQVVSSMLNMQARVAKDRDASAVLSESRDRINTMALIHTQLYETGNVSEMNMKVFVNGLLRQMLSSHQVQETRITPVVRVDEKLLPISIAVHLGLIINELLINAFKYAFVKRKAGEIEVDLRVSEKGVVNLTVSDDGVGLPDGFDINASKTLGLRMVKILVEEQLQGNLEINSDGGTAFKVEFEIAEE